MSCCRRRDDARDEKGSPEEKANLMQGDVEKGDAAGLLSKAPAQLEPPKARDPEPDVTLAEVEASIVSLDAMLKDYLKSRKRDKVSALPIIFFGNLLLLLYVMKSLGGSMQESLRAPNEMKVTEAFSQNVDGVNCTERHPELFAAVQTSNYETCGGYLDILKHFFKYAVLDAIFAESRCNTLRSQYCEGEIPLMKPLLILAGVAALLAVLGTGAVCERVANCHGRSLFSGVTLPEIVEANNGRKINDIARRLNIDVNKVSAYRLLALFKSKQRELSAVAAPAPDAASVNKV